MVSLQEINTNPLKPVVYIPAHSVAYMKHMDHLMKALQSTY